VRDFEGDPNVWRGDSGDAGWADDSASFARGLPDALGEAVAGFAPYGPDVIARGVERGRRIRRRRRMRDAFGVCAVAMVLVGVGMAWGPGGFRSGHADGAVPAASRASETEIGPAVTGEEMVAWLKTLLPPGQAELPFGRGSLLGGEGADRPAALVLTQAPYVTLVHRDPSGALTGVWLQVTRPAPGTAPGFEVFCAAVMTASGECIRKAESSSWVVMTEPGKPGVESFGTKDQTFYYDRPDGGRVMMRAFTAAVAKTPEEPATSLLNPVTLAAITQSPIWDRAVAALPASNAQAVGVLSRLMPTESVMSDLKGAGNEGTLLLRDDRGATTVHALVLPSNTPEPLCEKPDTDCVRKTLSDGTRLLTTRTTYTGNQGTSWAVSAMRPDGVIVRVDAINRDTTWNSPGRDEPQLSTDQLRDVALSPLWAR